MNNKIISNFILIFVLLFSVTFTSSASAHKSKKHKPLICIPEEDRTAGQRATDKRWNYFHRLSKLQQDCAMVEIEKLKGAVGIKAKCGNIPFGHISSASTSLRNDSKKKAEVIYEIKKGDEILFISEAEKNKNWSFVKVRMGKDDCAEGFILTKLILKKEVNGIISATELIDILEPSWTKKGKLILVDAEGNHTLKGVVGDGKIDKIVVNDEEEIILDDNSFKAQVFVPADGVEVRIIGYKNNQIKKKLIFTVKVGN